MDSIQKHITLHSSLLILHPPFFALHPWLGLVEDCTTLGMESLSASWILVPGHATAPALDKLNKSYINPFDPTESRNHDLPN